MTGRMVSKYRGECAECGHSWNAGDMIFFVEGDWKHWYCSESCARSVSVPVDAQTALPAQYSAPTVDIAVKRIESSLNSYQEGVQKAQNERQLSIKHAHDENMAANEALVRQLDHLTAAINKIAKWLVDDAMANRGLKL